MANAAVGRHDKRRRETQRQKKKRAQERICGWCESPDTVSLIDWYGRPPNEGKKPKKPLRIPICGGCKARLDTRWPDGMALCGHCGEPTNNIIDWLGPNGRFRIMMCAECHARLNGTWRPEGDVCGHCAMPAHELLEWTGLPYPIPICGDCKARLIDIQKQGEPPLWRRVWSWLMGD